MPNYRCLRQDNLLRGIDSITVQKHREFQFVYIVAIICHNDELS